VLTRAQKEAQVSELKERFARATGVIVADYRGIDVQSANVLRSKLRAGAYEYRVAKNTLLRLASQGTDVEVIRGAFEGPTAIAISFGDPVGLAKTLVDYAKDHENFQIRGGMVDGKALDRSQIGTLATLPSLVQLRGKLVGLLKAPATRLAGVLQAPAGQLARVVAARKDQLAAGGAQESQA
jgi:large subunit ribosomal protein L10